MSTPLPSDDVDLKRLLRKNFLAAGLSLLALAVIAAVLVVRFQAELDAITVAVFDSVGIFGLAGLLFVTDAVVSPFPPDSVLILISASPYHQYWPWLLPLLGLVSSCAGCVGYLCGRGLSHQPWALRWFASVHAKSEDRVARFGAWAVALGALTPIPFSLTCWTAGMIRMRFRSFILPCLLRIPRYVIYYAAIAYFPRLFS